ISEWIVGNPEVISQKPPGLFQPCRRFCSCQSLEEPQSSMSFNERPATNSISINYEPKNSAAFNRSWNLVRDRGSGGSPFRPVSAKEGPFISKLRSQPASPLLTHPDYSSCDSHERRRF